MGYGQSRRGRMGEAHHEQSTVGVWVGQHLSYPFHLFHQSLRVDRRKAPPLTVEEMAIGKSTASAKLPFIARLEVDILLL